MSPTDLLRFAYRAAEASPDPSTQNGAVLVRDGVVLLADCNRFPAGLAVTPERLLPGAKAQYIEHAERNVIYAAAAAGIETRGATLYCPWAACVECARAIIAAGIGKVVTHGPLIDLTPERWRGSVDAGTDLLMEAGVQLASVGGTVGGVRRTRARYVVRGGMSQAKSQVENQPKNETFSTGSVRDNRVGKGRFDLLPPGAIARVARHFEAGCGRYGERNWELGQNLSRYADSALRHLFRYLNGDTDEDHAAAAAWNVLCLMQTELWVKSGKLPADLDDLPK